MENIVSAINTLGKERTGRENSSNLVGREGITEELHMFLSK